MKVALEGRRVPLLAIPRKRGTLFRGKRSRVKAPDGFKRGRKTPEEPGGEREEKAMRFMLLMIPKGYEKAAAGTMPDPKAVETMMRFNQKMQEAGVLMSLDGLHPPSMGARVSFSKGKPTVTPGPFPGVPEVLGGFWMIDVRSLEEAIDWAKRCPASDHDVIEVRQLQELAEFPVEVRKAAQGFEKMQGKGKTG